MTKKSKDITLYIDEKLCKGCSICVVFCNKDVFVESDQINKQGYYVPIPEKIEECNGCMICELLCPELAIIIEIEEKEQVSNNPVSEEK